MSWSLRWEFTLGARELEAKDLNQNGASAEHTGRYSGAFVHFDGISANRLLYGIGVMIVPARSIRPSGPVISTSMLRNASTSPMRLEVPRISSMIWLSCPSGFCLEHESPVSQCAFAARQAFS